jgi:hypothetical protein
MTQVVNVIDHHIVSQVTADDGTVIQTHWHPEVMELKEIRFQFSDPDKAIEFTILDQGWIERV